MLEVFIILDNSISKVWVSVSVIVEKVSEWKEKQAAIAKGEVTPEEDVEMEEESLYKPDTEVHRSMDNMRY